MGLLILVVVGAILGWLATILTRIEDKRGILLNLGVGAAAAVLVGAVVNSGSVLLGVSGVSVLAAFAGSAAILAAFNFFRMRTGS
ncbi:GlsB/YeaQ/YmgE family stress response membrane protein [Altererythrobacter sp. MF3-039]|uniref:GlsB/YeaQ/YmgE family stress response membrane protein n=1 Tax=Altererythrobacter sp. MF3-039 TaxID=3252901 RepID=UPI00390C6B6C